MGLSTLVIPRETIRVTETQSFEVRGISLFDIMSAMGDYGPQMALLFSKAVQRDSNAPLTSDDVKARLRDLAREFPDVLAATIAMASDEYTPDAVRIARQLPLPTQTQAIEKIVRLTFTSESELGNLVESLLTGMASVTGALKEVNLSSFAGIGGSAVN